MLVLVLKLAMDRPDAGLSALHADKRLKGNFPRLTDWHLLPFARSGVSERALSAANSHVS
jgi:hypothetical protein